MATSIYDRDNCNVKLNRCRVKHLRSYLRRLHRKYRVRCVMVVQPVLRTGTKGLKAVIVQMLAHRISILNSNASRTSLVPAAASKVRPGEKAVTF